MRTHLTNRRLAMAAAVILALGAMAACGDDDGQGTAASFCDQIAGVDEAFDSIDDDVDDPTQLGSIFGEVEDALDSIDPPSEIADDWNTLTDVIGEVVDAVEDVDFEDPAALATLGEEFAELETRFADLEESTERIEVYADEECDIQLGE